MKTFTPNGEEFNGISVDTGKGSCAFKGTNISSWVCIQRRMFKSMQTNLENMIIDHIAMTISDAACEYRTAGKKHHFYFGVTASGDIVIDEVTAERIDDLAAHHINS